MPQIRIKVIPRAKKNHVVHQGDHFKVYVTAPPSEGRANEAVIELLSDYFKTKKRYLTLVRGATAREKVIDLTLPDPS